MLQIDQREALARYEQELVEEQRRRKERERELWERITAATPFDLTVRTDTHSKLDAPFGTPQQPSTCSPEPADSTRPGGRSAKASPTRTSWP
ncbi:hypothetical protein [Streptomyces sp. A012304]|uniref:hypothetical protein n=1 Tax=Streptomyces sp. A012304 TaxID=375446 RepID=UPI002232654C|nr:hypothetical protein [Streptomyces sp. A012304]GKQ33565.1 hypothetical protein ALMP_01160 [Streptomyces sp. A012304]